MIGLRKRDLVFQERVPLCFLLTLTLSSSTTRELLSRNFRTKTSFNFKNFVPSLLQWRVEKNFLPKIRSLITDTINYEEMVSDDEDSCNFKDFSPSKNITIMYPNNPGTSMQKMQEIFKCWHAIIWMVCWWRPVKL